MMGIGLLCSTSGSWEASLRWGRGRTGQGGGLALGGADQAQVGVEIAAASDSSSQAGQPDKSSLTLHLFKETHCQGNLQGLGEPLQLAVVFLGYGNKCSSSQGDHKQYPGGIMGEKVSLEP